MFGRHFSMVNLPQADVHAPPMTGPMPGPMPPNPAPIGAGTCAPRMTNNLAPIGPPMQQMPLQPQMQPQMLGDSFVGWCSCSDFLLCFSSLTFWKCDTIIIWTYNIIYVIRYYISYIPMSMNYFSFGGQRLSGLVWGDSPCRWDDGDGDFVFWLL